MIDITLLKEESNQPIYLMLNGTWKEGKFMWFYNGNIEIRLNESITLLSIPKRHWKRLSLTGINFMDLCLN